MLGQNQSEVRGIFVGKELMRRMKEMAFGAYTLQLFLSLGDSEIL